MSERDLTWPAWRWQRHHSHLLRARRQTMHAGRNDHGTSTAKLLGPHGHSTWKICFSFFPIGSIGSKHHIRQAAPAADSRASDAHRSRYRRLSCLIIICEQTVCEALREVFGSRDADNGWLAVNDRSMDWKIRARRHWPATYAISHVNRRLDISREIPWIDLVSELEYDSDRQGWTRLGRAWATRVLPAHSTYCNERQLGFSWSWNI
jgi:hypothetical protein